MASYIAKEIAPEYVSSEFEFDIDYEVNNGGLNLYGNKDYNSHTSALFDKVMEALEWFDEWYCAETCENATDCVYDIFGEYLEIDHARKVNEKDCAEIVDVLRNNNFSYMENDICTILTLLTGRCWDWKTIKGSCQGDWQTMYYDSSWTPDIIDRFEIAYFNMGKEFQIVEADGEEITTIYCYEWDDEKIAREIRDGIGIAENDTLKILWFDGWKRIAQYRETY